MSNYSPDVASQVPAGGNPSSPSSGSYGAKSEVQRLQAEMDAAGPATQPTPEQPMSLPPPPAQQPSGGLPAALEAPTRNPGEPVFTMPAQAPTAYVGTPPEQRIQFYTAVLSSPNYSSVTKEFAKLALDRMLRRGR